MAIKPEDLLKINESIKKAEEDTTPYPVVVDGKVHVVGDANKTENKKHDYTIKFRFPKSYEQYFDGNVLERIGDYIIVETEFKDVTITPRSDMKILAAISKILPYVKKLDDDGTVREMTDDEIIDMCLHMPDEIEDAMYILTASVLRVDESIRDWMLATSVFGFISDFINDFPEVSNEADAFFG